MDKTRLESMIARLNTYDAEEQVVIALDFGTTYSGVAYCFPNKENSKVATIVNWPGKQSAISLVSEKLLTPSYRH